MKDFYYILGTASNASPAEIDEAYQKLARKFYPAEGEHDDFLEEHLREITEAYDVLRDAKRRRAYDTAFRRGQERQLAAFKVKYLNIGITIMFLAVTALFAGYVIRTLRGHASKKAAVQKPAPQPAPTVGAVMHVKKHRQAISQGSPVPVTKLAAQDTVAGRAEPVPIIPPQIIADSTGLATLHANITGVIYLHKSPDYNSAVIAKIPDGAQVRILRKGSSWCKVEFNEQKGYVIRAIVEGK